MHASRHHAAHPRNQLSLARHGNDASRRAHHVHCVALANVRADRVPVRVECSHGNRNSRAQPQLCRPLRRKFSRQMIAGQVFAAHLRAHAGKQRIDRNQETLRRQPSPFWIPHPLVAHRAYAALHRARLRYPAQRCRHHVAMFKRRHQPRAFLRVVPQPVQQLCKSPLVRVDASAPLDALEPQLVCLARDLLGLGKRAMIAPQVVFIERLEALTHGNYARSRRIERDRSHLRAIDARRLQRIFRRRGQRSHLVGVRLCRVIWVLSLAVQRIAGRRSPDRPFLAVD